MKEIDIKQIISGRYPGFAKKPKWMQKIAVRLIEKAMHLKEINEFIRNNSDVMGIPFIDNSFEMINFSFTVAHNDYKKIPSEGRLICVSNHPLGGLDGLALIRAMVEVRPDVKIIANDILMTVENINEYFLPFTLDSKSAQRDNIRAIGEALEKEMAVIIFPAAEVSRLRGLTIVDNSWNKGPVYFAKKFNAPVLPMYVKAKNSPFFYLFSVFFKALSTILLPREMFYKKNKTIRIKIGDPIPAKAFTANVINDAVQIKLLKKHTYLIGRNKRGVYTTEKNIIHPVDKVVLKKELKNSQLLGLTTDKKHIYVTNMEDCPGILEEIARLREITFRKVGEGTGKKLDIDIYDKYYKHIVVWDDDDLEIVGAYRIGVGKEFIAEKGYQGYYTSTLFKFDQKFIDNYLPYSIELGRSFVQKKYWNTNALHYLWLGIGSFLAVNPDVKYMFGPVSLSNSYPETAKSMICYYFDKWYGPEEKLVTGNQVFKIAPKELAELKETFKGETYREDFRTLKSLLKPMGFTVPILFKHYSELCDSDGVQFHTFSVDPDFENCIDGFLVVEVGKMKPEKYERYVNYFRKQEEAAEV